MCDIISVTWRELPLSLVEQNKLISFDRGNGEPEYHFSFREHTPRLPVWTEGQLLILPWAGYCPKEALEAGRWAQRQPIPIVVPASLCCDRGIWFLVREGIHGILVGRYTYLLTEPASHYYRIMTRHERMPVLIGESI